MSLLKPQEVVEPKNPEVMVSILKINKNIAQMILKHQHSPIPEEQLLLSKDLLKEETGIEFSIKEVRDIICSYPYCRASIIMFGVEDTEARGSLFNALSLLALSCSWPEYRDKVNMDKFVEALNKQIKLVFNKN